MMKLIRVINKDKGNYCWINPSQIAYIDEYSRIIQFDSGRNGVMMRLSNEDLKKILNCFELE